MLTPKQSGLQQGIADVSQKATICDHEDDHLSTGEPITLNFNALGGLSDGFIQTGETPDSKP